MLFITKFEANSNVNVFTELSSFLVIKKYISRLEVESPSLLNSSVTQRAKRDIKLVDIFINKIDQMRIYLRDQLKWFQAL